MAGFDPRLEAHYRTFLSLRLRSEDIQHTTLYNTLMANSLLIVSAAAVSVSSVPERYYVSLLLGTAGLFLTSVVLGYQVRLGSYARTYELRARRFETRLRSQPRSFVSLGRPTKDNYIGPLQTALRHQRRLANSHLRFFRLKYLLWYLHFTFVIIYFTIFSFSATRILLSLLRP